MKHKLVLVIAACLLVPSAFAANERCTRGSPPFQKDLWEGYSVQIGAAADDARKDQCRAAIVGPGGRRTLRLVLIC